MLMLKIGKLSKDWQRLAKAFTQIGACLQLYKIGHHWIQPTLFDVWVPTMLTYWLLFPYDKGHKNTSMLITMLVSYMYGCGKLLKRLKCSPHQRWRDRSGTMIGKLMPFHWNQVTWSWLKLMPTGGGGKWRTGGRRNHTKWSTRLLKASLPTFRGTSGQHAHEFSTENGFISLLLQMGLLSVWSCELSRSGVPLPP